MKNCKNCFWYDKCEDRCDDDIEVDCDYYEPLDDEEIAIEEYEKVNTRYEFLSNQKEDLLKAKASL